MGRALWLIIVLSLIAPSRAQDLQRAIQAVQNADKWSQDATFIFQGTVVNPHGTTLPALSGQAGLAVVQVENVYQGVPPDSTFLHRQITVRMLPGESLSSGDRHTFFTRGWIYGDSIAVIEIGKLSAIEWTAFHTKSSLTHLYADAANKSLIKRYLTANSVVIGTVQPKVIVLPATVAGLGNEHDPMPAQATISVELVLKGDSKIGSKLPVMFARSRDALYWRAPKLKGKEHALFFLRKGTNQFPSGSLTLLNPDDFRPLKDSALMQTLIRTLKPQQAGGKTK